MTPIIYVHKTHAEEFRYSSVARKNKYISVEYVQAWIDNNRLNNNPLPFDKQTVAQNEVYTNLEALINTE